MKVYVFQAALLCESCADNLRRMLHATQDFGTLESRQDSDRYPQGPYADGGGEADSPSHCDSCGLFLRNPLTADGEEYVREALCECRELTHVCGDVCRTWGTFYPHLLPTDEEEVDGYERDHAELVARRAYGDSD